jgi:hypothetical protein
VKPAEVITNDGRGFPVMRTFDTPKHHRDPAPDETNLSPTECAWRAQRLAELMRTGQVPASDRERARAMCLSYVRRAQLARSITGSYSTGSPLDADEAIINGQVEDAERYLGIAASHGGGNAEPDRSLAERVADARRFLDCPPPDHDHEAKVADAKPALAGPDPVDPEVRRRADEVSAWLRGGGKPR